MIVGAFMVLEYCENGTLNSYLSKHKDKVNDDMHERLFKFSLEICKGMNFLASRGVRSCFVCVALARTGQYNSFG